MPRLKSVLVRFAGLLASAALLWVVVAEPVETGELEESLFLDQSLRSLEQAVSGLPPREPGQLFSGAAKVEIVPPIEWDVPLGGNRRLRFARAEGVRPESVWARAVAMRQGQSAFVLVSADIMVIYPEFASSILQRVRETIDIRADQLMVVAAHSHSGPGGYWRGTLPEMSIGPFQARLREFLVERLARAAVEAWGSMEPVDASGGGALLELPIKNRTRLDGPENAELGVLRFEARDTSRVIDLVNYSAHPTNLLRENRQLTGDYPALMAMFLEESSSGRQLVFTPGTIGDQKPWFHREKNATVKAEAIARLLHDTLVGTELDAMEAPVLEAFEFEVRMPPLQPRLVRSDWLGSWAARSWLAKAVFPTDLDRTVVQVVRIGRTALIGAPSDLATSVAEPLLKRARRAGLRVLFVSMAEDWIGYVMTREEYEDVAYKETSQFHGPLSGPLFLEVYGRLIERLAERAVSDPVASSEAKAG